MNMQGHSQQQRTSQTQTLYDKDPYRKKCFWTNLIEKSNLYKKKQETTKLNQRIVMSKDILVSVFRLRSNDEFQAFLCQYQGLIPLQTQLCCSVQDPEAFNQD